jgi:hypothetical protein
MVCVLIGEANPDIARIGVSRVARRAGEGLTATRRHWSLLPRSHSLQCSCHAIPISGLRSSGGGANVLVKARCLNSGTRIKDG